MDFYLKSHGMISSAIALDFVFDHRACGALLSLEYPATLRNEVSQQSTDGHSNKIID